MRDFLFGFTTTRNPSTISASDRDRYHILMAESDRRETQYWSDHDRQTFVGLLRDIRRRGVSVSGIPGLQALKSEFGDMLAFYRAAKSDARRADLSDLHAVAADLDVSALTSSARVQLWDTLAHYLWVDEQRAAVDTVHAIMVADKLLNALEELAPDDMSDATAQADLRRMMRAQMVLPLPIEAAGRERVSRSLSARQREMLEQAHDRIVASAERRRLLRVREDLTLAVARFRSRRSDSERDSGLRSRTIIREALSATLSAEEVDTVAATVAGRLAAAESPQDDVSGIMATLATAEAAAVLQPLTARATSIASLDLVLNDELRVAEDAAEGEIETAHLVAFWAFGTEFTIEERIPAGAMIVKMRRGADGQAHLFLSYFHDRKVPVLAEVRGQILLTGGSQPIAGEPLQVDRDGFQTFRLSSEPFDAAFADVELILRTADPQAERVALDPFRVFLQVPHFDIPDLSEDPVIGLQPPPPMHGIESLGVIEYRRVEQELACYVTGAVSRIESIPARAFKERTSRALSMTETEQDITQETASERQTDSETTEKHEMQSEIESVLREEESKTFDFGAGVSAKLPGIGSLTTETSMNFNAQSASEESTSQAITMAKQVTQKVQEKIMQKTTARRRSLARYEFEDIIKTGYDNRLGENHVVCVHRWVDKIMNNYLVNYGRMSVAECVIPEPAINFIRAMEVTREEEDFTARRPKRPRLIGLRGPKSVNVNNYRRFAKAYGITLDPPPRKTVVISRSFADSMSLVGGTDEKTSPNRAIAYNEIAVPDGYAAVHAAVEGTYEDALIEDGNVWSGGGTMSVAVGNSDFLSTADLESVDLDKIEGSVPVGVMCRGAGAIVLNVTVTCQSKFEIEHRWQIESYARLIDAYRKLKDEYDAQREDHEAVAEKALDLNPRFKRQVMERELKRVCIEMIARNHNIEISWGHYDPAPAGELFPIRLTPQLDEHAKLVSFLEQAVNWSLMSYIFYPYFYAPRESWSVKISHEATRDRLFAAFLSAGMSRVMLPIRPGFEAVFSYFLHTGRVWSGSGFVLDSEDDLYLSVADEMSTGTEERVIEERWQTKLPTNLTMLQDAASAMIGEGLPCEFEDNRIGAGSSTLGPVLPERGGSEPG